jgi:hypothetical protein
MAENPDNPAPPRRGRGRPRKVRHDPARLDPLAVLREIAADPRAAPSARVAAAKRLLEEPRPSFLDFLNASDAAAMDREVERVAVAKGLDRRLRPPGGKAS